MVAIRGRDLIAGIIKIIWSPPIARHRSMINVRFKHQGRSELPKKIIRVRVAGGAIKNALPKPQKEDTDLVKKRHLLHFLNVRTM